MRTCGHPSSGSQQVTVCLSVCAQPCVPEHVEPVLHHLGGPSCNSLFNAVDAQDNNKNSWHCQLASSVHSIMSWPLG